MLIGCTCVGEYSDWLHHSIASIYNVVDKIVIADSSPFGHFVDRYINKLKKFPNAESKIHIIFEDWMYPPHPYAKGLPQDPLNFGIGRIANSACVEARRLGATQILWFFSDHIFSPTIKKIKGIPEGVDRRCQYWNFASFEHVELLFRDEEYETRLKERNGQSDFEVSMFCMNRNAGWEGNEAAPRNVGSQINRRDIWFAHPRDFCPDKDRLWDYLYERFKVRIRIRNLNGEYDKQLSEEEEEEKVKVDVEGCIHSLGLRLGNKRKVGEHLAAPYTPEAMLNPYKYVEEGKP